MDLGSLMRQAQNMQAKMKEAQEELKNKEITGISGNGACKIVMSGDGSVKSLTISEKLLDDKEILEDLIIVCFNDAKSKADKLSEETMKESTGGMKLPF